MDIDDSFHFISVRTFIISYFHNDLNDNEHISHS